MWSINVHLRLLKATIECVCVFVDLVVVGVGVVVNVVVVALLVHVTDHIILSCGR